MEIYPSIPRIIQPVPIIAWDKLDGSNIRAEWTKKQDFSKFGTRKRLLGADEEPYGEAIHLFQEKYADDLSRIFRKERWDKATAFFEFYGEHSFAGQHEAEEHTVTLFDVHLYKGGMLQPREFLKLFGNRVELPTIVYEGKPTEAFQRAVRESKLEGITFEGVVCKGGIDKRNRPITFKVKTQAWLDRLKEKYGHSPQLYEQLL